MLVGNAFDAVRELFVQIGAVAKDPEPAQLSALLGAGAEHVPDHDAAHGARA